MASVPVRRGRYSVAWPLDRVSVPPSAIASRAFTARFTSTWSSCPGSTSTRRPGCSSASTTVTFSPSSRRSNRTASSIAAFTATTRGTRVCWRENASNWRTNAAPRSTPWRICCASSAVSAVVSVRARIASAAPRMAVSRLLKSWAIPPASWPTTCSLRACSCAGASPAVASGACSGSGGASAPLLMAEGWPAQLGGPWGGRPCGQGARHRR